MAIPRPAATEQIEIQSEAWVQTTLAFARKVPTSSGRNSDNTERLANTRTLPHMKVE
jgi:hypothetical protein